MQLTHGRTRLELHERRAGSGSALLLLHELGGAGSEWDAAPLETWSGPIYALDFSGHGASEHLLGSGYSPESFLGDADQALKVLSRLGPCAVVGAGIGGYVAILLAAARAEYVSAAMILPGRGLAGGGLIPRWKERRFKDLDGWNADIARRASRYLPATDPMVAECECDIRPEAYVREFADGVRVLMLSEAVGNGDEVPEWWPVAMNAKNSRIVSADRSQALAELRRVCNKENAA